MLHVTGTNSYPSGHTGFITAVTIAGCFLLVATGHRFRLWLPIGLLLVCLVGFSRMLLAVHYPTDVLGGFLLARGFSLVLWPVLTGLLRALEGRGRHHRHA